MGFTDTSLKDCISEGEKITFDFFKNKLSADYSFWNNLEVCYRDKYSGDRKSAEIDMLLYNDELGLFLFSIKDWRIEQIDYMENNSFYRKNHKEDDRPISDLKKQFNYLKQYLDSKNELLDGANRLKFPINYSIIFPYIYRSDFENKTQQVSSYITEKSNTGNYLFADLFENERTLKDKFVAKNIFDNLRSVKFISCLSKGEKEFLFSTLSSFRGGVTEKEKVYYPVSQIGKVAEPKIEYAQPETFDAEDDIFASIEDVLVRLDKEQVNIANSYLKHLLNRPGHLILKGSAGSGKTIILLQMFYRLAGIKDKNYRIAYISRQHSLANDFRQKLSKRGINVKDSNESGSFVGVFHEFIKIFFGPEYAGLEKDKNNYPKDSAISNFIERNIDRVPELFDFIFIDEGHNLPDMWVKFIVAAAVGKSKGKVVYTEDQQQNIYGLKRNFAEAGLDEKLTRSLNINYRNTYEIYHFAKELCGKGDAAGRGGIGGGGGGSGVSEPMTTADIEIKDKGVGGGGSSGDSVIDSKAGDAGKVNKLLEVRLGRVPELIGLNNLENKTGAAKFFRRIFTNTAWIRKSNAAQIAEIVFEKFENWLNEGFLPDEVALIYPVSKIFKSGNEKTGYKKLKNRKPVDNLLLCSLFDIFKKNEFLFKHTYSQSRILGKFSKRYENLILSYDSAPNYKAINLVTAMSSQGLSYKCIILLLDGFEAISWFGGQEIINMLYTSVTRATHELVLVSMDENEYSRRAAKILGALNKNCE